jgi:hypothetical protein
MFEMMIAAAIGWRNYPIMNVAPDADAPQKARANFPGETK